MLNYTFAFASAEANAPDVVKNMGFAMYPKVVEDEPAKPPLGGFNIGVGAYSDHSDQAFEAASCISSSKSQLTATELDGLPPSRASLYKSKIVQKAYPGVCRARQEVDRRRGPSPADTGLPGCLAGDPGRDPAAVEDRSQRPDVVV